MAPVPSPVPSPPGSPGLHVGLRLVTSYDEMTRRVDVQLRGSQGVVVEGDTATPFRAEQLWPVLRGLLPPLAHVTADPTGARVREGRRPGATFVDDCTAMVTLATLVATDEDTEPASIAVRTWLATVDELWSVEARPDGTNDVHTVPAGSIGELLVWDVTAAMEALVRILEPVS